MEPDVHRGGLRAPDPLTWEGILRQLADEIPELVSDFMWQFQARELYALYDVSEKDLIETARESLVLQVGRLRGVPDAPGTAGYIQRLAVRRVRQGVPLATFLRANRLDFRVLWHRLQRIAGEEGSTVIAANVTTVLDSVERFIDELRSAYSAEEARLDRGDSQRHRAILRLFSGEKAHPSDIDLIADRLGFHPESRFEVLAVIGDAITVQLGRYEGDPTVAIFEAARSLILFREQTSSGAWRDEVVGRGGYVGDVAGLSQVPTAASSALAIARHAPSAPVQFFTEADVWAPVAYRHLVNVFPRYTKAMHDALQAESEHDRELIIEATSEYLETGSVKITAERLFCHRNTVIKRLRYFTQATGFDPTVPRDAAWIHIVLNGSESFRRVHMHSPGRGPGAISP